MQLCNFLLRIIKNLFTLLLYLLLAVLCYIIWLIISPDSDIYLPEYYKEETSLLCDVSRNVEKDFERKFGLRSYGSCYSYSSTVCNIYHSFGFIRRKTELFEARKIAFKVVEQYRIYLAKDERARIFYRSRRPDYNLQEQHFPVERIDLGIYFNDESKLDTYLDPYIAYVGFENGEFCYKIRKNKSDDLEVIFRETYEEAKNYYYSENTHLNDPASSAYNILHKR